jgi:hypothetical protein
MRKLPCLTSWLPYSSIAIRFFVLHHIFQFTLMVAILGTVDFTAQLRSDFSHLPITLELGEMLATQRLTDRLHFWL